MAGVYIQGMEMPTKDGVYTLRIWGTGQIERLDGYHSFLLSGVKAVPVLEHGRLIDADALDDILADQSDDAYNRTHAPRSWERALSVMRDYLKDSPTIILADKEDD